MPSNACQTQWRWHFWSIVNFILLAHLACVRSAAAAQVLILVLAIITVIVSAIAGVNACTRMYMGNTMFPRALTLLRWHSSGHKPRPGLGETVSAMPFGMLRPGGLRLGGALPCAMLLEQLLRFVPLSRLLLKPRRFTLSHLVRFTLELKRCRNFLLFLPLEPLFTRLLHAAARNLSTQNVVPLALRQDFFCSCQACVMPPRLLLAVEFQLPLPLVFGRRRRTHTRFGLEPAQMAGVCLGASRCSSLFNRFPPELPSATTRLLTPTERSCILIRFYPGIARGLKPTPSIRCCGRSRGGGSCGGGLASGKLPRIFALKVACSTRRGPGHCDGVLARQPGDQCGYGCCCC